MSPTLRRHKLRAMMKNHRMTAEIVAIATFHSKNTVYAWRNGRRTVPRDALRLLEYYITNQG